MAGIYDTHPMDLLEKLASEGDDIAYACIRMHQNGAFSELVLTAAIRAYAQSNKHLKETLQNHLERTCEPMIVLKTER